MITAIVLAAGESRRMGSANKLLLPFGETTLIEHVVRTVRQSEAGDVIVVLGHEADRVRAVLEGHQDPVWSLRYTPDGRRLVSAGADEVLRVWDLANAREIGNGVDGLAHATAWDDGSRGAQLFRKCIACPRKSIEMRIEPSEAGSRRMVICEFGPLMRLRITRRSCLTLATWPRLTWASSARFFMRQCLEGSSSSTRSMREALGV